MFRDKDRAQYRTELKAKADSELESLRGLLSPSQWQYNAVQAEIDSRSTQPSAAKPGGMSKDFEQIVTSVYEIDTLKEYTRLESQLTIGEDRSDYATVLSHLDRAENNARVAHKLYLSSKIERERWQAENEPIRAAIWSKAERELQREKDDKARNKSITNEDVRARALELHPDEFQAYEMYLARVNGTEKHLEKLSELWTSRCRTLQVILQTLRK